MKINKSIIGKSILSVGSAVLLNSCSFLNIFAPPPYQLIHDSNGNEVLRDTKAEREDFESIMNNHIEHELAKDHAPGAKNHDWHAFWMNRIRFIKSGSENPQWYVDYITKTRRNAGLHEL